MNEYIESPVPPIGEVTSEPSPARSLDARRAFHILGVFLLIQFLTAIAIVIVVLVVLLALGSSIPTTELEPQLQAIALIPAALAGMAFGGFAAFRMTRHTLPGSIASGALSPIGWSWGSGRALVFSGLLGAIISWFVIDFLIPGYPHGSVRSFNPLVEAAATPGLRRLGWAFLVVAMAPLAEEFLFRGVLLEGFRRSWGLMTSCLVVTVLFIAGHLLQTQYWPALVGISLVACATLFVRLVSRALGPSLVLHAAYNFVILIAVYTRSL